MAAIAVHQLAPCITCHAWSPDFSMIAFCPNNNEVHIYKFVEERWEKKHVLQKHDQIVSGIDWSARSNRLVTVSHDRNSYVWNQEGEEWVPTLVILRLNRAALCVQWSPRENKFSVGSGAKTVCICYYEQDNNWWVSKLIRKRHESSVTCVAWHPNNILLATTSTDGKCRVFSTFIKGVDPRDPGAGSASDSKFGEVIIQQSTSLMKLVLLLQLKLWHFVICLFVMWVLFVSERMVIGVGFDCSPMVFAADESGLWSFHRFLGERKASPSGAKYGSQFSEAFGKFYGQSKHGINNDMVGQSRPRGSVHENCINCILPVKRNGKSTITSFSTSGLDGKVVVWDLENQDDLSEYL
ncbi:actin-related protein 2/3 complex subunit 1A isoform X2 [Diospyros lotus]|uniref:actin-related protein 2/3 complex subunit 1A isoform X2 n=1 Tax=Diospyros lotus TaxID=55363 RepID=UPI0022567A9D|nr:actin-related protein 2/3 complex subunit 1A isoform X2 [Diospyros lotus]